jgi:hypothetical protein
MGHVICHVFNDYDIPAGLHECRSTEVGSIDYTFIIIKAVTRVKQASD